MLYINQIKSCEETKSTVTSDSESRQNESDSTPVEPQAGMFVIVKLMSLSISYTSKIIQNINNN